MSAPSLSPRRKRTAVIPQISPAEAQRRLNNMTRAEHERVTAYLVHQTFAAAARALDCDQETVARTWKMHCGLIAVILQEFKTPLPSPH